MAPKRTRQPVKQSTDEQSAAPYAVVPTEGSEEKPMPSTDKPTQGLKFVNVTPRYLQGQWNSAEQKAIRVHVMQDFLRQKREPIEPIEPPVMAGTVSSHIHRFRIAKPRHREDKSVEASSSPKAVACLEQGLRYKPLRLSPTNSIRVSADLVESEIVNLATRDQPIRLGTLISEERPAVLTPRISPNLGGVKARMDPFARLPIDGSIETHKILDYYRTSYWSNSLAINPDGRWLSVVATDPALFHAQLSLVAQHRALSRGASLSKMYYYHRGMAISIVTSRLMHPVEAISDQTIATVALLSNSDNYFEVPPEVQHAHMNGLLSLVQLRGGLHTLNDNESVRRVVTWADLVHAASNDRKPCLGLTHFNARDDLKQLFPSSSSAKSAACTVYLEEAPVPARLKEVFETIRLLSIAQSSPDVVDLQSTANRRILSNALYQIEYLLLDPLLLTLRVFESPGGSGQLDYSGFGEPLLLATTAGALIFTYSCLRNLAIPFRPFERLVRRLRVNLQMVFDEERSTYKMVREDCGSLGANRGSPSPATAHPSLLLWLLMHGFKATRQGHRESDGEWFVRRGAEMCRDLKIQRIGELFMRIKQVVAFRLQCIPTTEAFWKAICDEHEAANDVSET